MTPYLFSVVVVRNFAVQWLYEGETLLTFTDINTFCLITGNFVIEKHGVHMCVARKSIHDKYFLK